MQNSSLMENTRIFQVEGVTATQFFEVFKCLETQIKELKEQTQKREPKEGYLTRQQVAELLGVSLVTLTDWTNKGFISSYRLGNKVYYKRSEIDAAMVEIKKGGRQ